MNTYVCFYRDRKIEVQADTTFAAQKIAAEKFRARKSYEVSVHLVALDGAPYVHTAVD